MQQQALSTTHIQLSDKANKIFYVKLETQEGVECGDVEIGSLRTR